MKKASDFLNEISEELSSIDNKEDQIKQLLDYGKFLTKMDDEDKSDENIVKGCSSLTYVKVAFDSDGSVVLSGDSESLFARSYLYILINAFNGYKVTEIINNSRQITDGFINKSSTDLSLIESRVNSFRNIYNAIISKCLSAK